MAVQDRVGGGVGAWGVRGGDGIGDGEGCGGVGIRGFGGLELVGVAAVLELVCAWFWNLVFWSEGVEREDGGRRIGWVKGAYF